MNSLLRIFAGNRRRHFSNFVSAALLILLLPITAAAFQPSDNKSRIPPIAASELPKEARETLALIRKGGPFPYAKDGTIFGNREKLLPFKPRGHYREYTVKTPGARNRGARRIVAGGKTEFFYTDDHYASFKRIQESP